MYQFQSSSRTPARAQPFTERSGISARVILTSNSLALLSVSLAGTRGLGRSSIVSVTSVPAGPVLGYSVLPADAGSTVRFTGPEIYLTAGQPYAIVLSTRAPSPPVSGYFFGVAGIDAYPRGGLWLRTAGAWEPLANNDLLFVTHMDPNVPEIRLDTPRNGARLREGEPLRLRALWGAGGPPPVRVDFLANARPLGSVAQEPYELIWNDPPAGLQNLVAIAVTATGSSTGRVVAVSVLPPGPANDDFAHRNRLDGAWVRAAFGNAGATREPGEHLPLATTGQTLWWSWTANSLATTTVAVGGPASTNAVIGVYRGAVAEALVQVAQGIGACSFLGESGSEYQIQVDSMDAVLAGATLEVATPDLELTGPVPGTGHRRSSS